eukprot:TRINITY_DN67743_c9_g1_i2.p1 TRINITY_DN67743_c9_g1~~TRINITY_DN67743_c9_g1_i2.p1  ORF type:complete len:352 (+),score=26.09 TRINITY_DN67743_c9_g1_i2:312-1367(+)
MYNAFGTEFVFARSQLTNLMYDIWASLWVGYKLIFTKDITPAMRRFPLWKLAILSCFDALSDLLSSIGGVNTLGSMQTLLQQTQLVFVLILAYFALQRRYSVWQILGCTVIIGGAVLAIIPQFVNEHKAKKAGKETTQGIWYFTVVYFVSNIPKSFSYVGKEWCFQQMVLDVMWVSCLVSWMQLGLAWVFYPITTIHVFGGVPFDKVGHVMKDGFRCFFGDINVIVHDHGGYHQCSSYVTYITLAFSISGFLAGVSQLYVMQRASSALMITATVVGLPLANLAFCIKPFMGNAVEAVNKWDVAGLCVVVAGFIGYSFAEYKKTQEELRTKWIQYGEAKHQNGTVTHGSGLQ